MEEIILVIGAPKDIVLAKLGDDSGKATEATCPECGEKLLLHPVSVKTLELPNAKLMCVTCVSKMTDIDDDQRTKAEQLVRELTIFRQGYTSRN